jgi:hypothetical protein
MTAEAIPIAIVTSPPPGSASRNAAGMAGLPRDGDLEAVPCHGLSPTQASAGLRPNPQSQQPLAGCGTPPRTFPGGGPHGRRQDEDNERHGVPAERRQPHGALDQQQPDRDERGRVHADDQPVDNPCSDASPWQPGRGTTHVRPLEQRAQEDDTASNTTRAAHQSAATTGPCRIGVARQSGVTYAALRADEKGTRDARS